MKKGKYFEKLVASIENALNPFDYVQIKHNQFIKDKSGRSRQIDILIESDWGRHGKQIIIIESKNWKTKVEVENVEAFITKIERVGASKGIMVSKLGFQQGAIDAAEDSNRVSLYTLDELNREIIESWTDIPNLKFGYRISNEEINVTTKFSFDSSLNIPEEVLDSYEGPIFKNGKQIFNSLLELAIEYLMRNDSKIKQYISQKAFEIVKESATIHLANLTLKQPLGNLSYYFQLNGSKIFLSEIEIKIQLEVFIEKSGSLKFHSYKELGKKRFAKVSTVVFEDSTLEIIENESSGETKYFVIPKNASEVIEIQRLV